VPIRDFQEKHRVIGILVATIELEKLRSWPLHTRTKSLAGMVVLVDDRNYCLLHEGVKDENIELRPLPACECFDEARNETGKRLEYLDPKDQNWYLASFAPVSTIHGAVVVQHDIQSVDEAAGGTSDQIRERLVSVGLRSLVPVGLLLSGLWGWIL